MWRKSGQHGPKLGPKMEPKSMENDVENQSDVQCLLESIFYAMLVDFWWKNGGKLAQKSIPNRCAQFEKRCFEKTKFFFKKNNDLDGPGGPSWGSKPIKIQ